jgi:hypothetical protein
MLSSPPIGAYRFQLCHFRFAYKGDANKQLAAAFFYSGGNGMNQEPEKSKSNWPRNFEVLLIGATAILSGLISLLDFLGLLDGITWLAERIPTLTLLATGLVAGYLVLERRHQLEGMQRDTDQRIKELTKSLSQSTVTIIESLGGVELRRFETGNEMISYVNKRLLQARQRIDDLSWSPVVGLEHSLEATQEV